MMQKKQRPLQQKTVGILGGMSDKATHVYYKKLNQAVNDRLGGWDIAEVLIQGVNFGNIEHWVRNDQWEDAKEYLQNKAKLAEAGGADFLVCASNTMHKVLDDLKSVVSIPFLHIAHPTGEQIIALGLNKVGLLGTRPVMAHGYIQDYLMKHFNIEVIVPDEEDQLQVDQIIFDELVKDQYTSASKQVYCEISKKLQAQGAQGIILGCTEILLLLEQEDLPDLPLIDTTQEHIHGILKLLS